MSKLISDYDFFYSMDIPCLLLQANPPYFHIVDANNAYLLATFTDPKNIIGKSVFDAFPDNPGDVNPSGTRNLAETLTKVVDTKKTQKLTEQKYDIYVEPTGQFEIRYWNATNSPVLDNTGEIRYIIHTVEDVTSMVHLKESEKRNFETIQYNKEVYKSLFDNNPDPAFAFDLAGNFFSANQNMALLIECEVSEIIGKNFLLFVEKSFQNLAFNLFQNAKTGELSSFTLKMCTAKGNIKTVAVTNSPIILNQQLIGVFGIAKDLTEKIENEIKLSNALTEIEKIFDSSLDMICTIDQSGKFRKVSKASVQMLGYQPEELIDQSFTDLVHPDDKETTDLFQHQIIAGLQTSNFQNRCIGKDSRIVPIVWSAHWDEKDQLMYCIARDNSERASVEEVLRKERKALKVSNERYEYATKATFDAVWDWDLKTNTIYWGEGFATLFGYDITKMGNDVSSWTSHIHPDDLDSVVKGIYEVINGDRTNWSDKYRYQKANGEYAMVFDRGFVIKKSDGTARRMIGAMQDITQTEILENERKKNEKELARAYAEKNQILESIGDAFFTMDKHFVVSYWNRVAEEITGIKRETLIGKKIWEVFPDALNYSFYDHYKKALETGQPVFFEEYYDGWLEVNAYPSEQGLTIFFRDISLRKEAEAVLKKSFQEQQEILESIGDGFFAMDADFIVTYWNNKAEEFLLKKKEDMVGKKLWDEFPVSIYQNFSTNFGKVLADKSVIHFEAYIDPLCKWFDISAYPQKNGVSVYFRDITDTLNQLNAIEEKNKKLHKIAWTQSHLVRAPLSKILGLAQLIAMQHGDNTALHEKLTYLTKAATELDNIICGLIKEAEVMNKEK